MAIVRSCAFAKHIKKLNITISSFTLVEVTSAAERLESFLAAFGGTIRGEIRLYFGQEPHPGVGDPVYKALMAARISDDVILYHAQRDTIPSFASTSVWQEFQESFGGTSAAMPRHGWVP
ncbi:hypothetical protein LTR17_022772 [Elasticomyces elasticus]|nr:hypothetical protein LTR17_022772 [Elasticomyces elasticus]